MGNAAYRIGNKKIDYLQERIKGLTHSAEEIGKQVPSDEAFLMTIRTEISHANSLIEFYKMSKN
jgi:hypothetical protein